MDNAAAGTVSATAPSAAQKLKTYNLGRWMVWGGYALVMLAAPMLWKSSLSLTMLSQMGIAIIACMAEAEHAALPQQHVEG